MNAEPIASGRRPSRPSPAVAGRSGVGLVGVVFVTGSALALAACEGGVRGGGGEIEIGELPVRVAVEVVRLGGPSAAEPEVFQRAPSLEVGPDGSVFLLDRATDEVRRFSPDGEFLNSIGRRGEGPGEFQSPVGLGFVSDTLWVREIAPARLSFFTVDGTYLRMAGFPEAVIGRTGVPEAPEAALTGGSYFMVGQVPWGGPDGRVDVPLMIEHGPGGARDTLATRPTPSGIRIAGMGTFSGIRPFPLPALHSVVPGGAGVIVAEWTTDPGPDLAGAAVVRRYGSDASVELVDTLRFPAIPLLPSVVDSIVSSAVERMVDIRSRFPEPGTLPADLEGEVRAELGLGAVHPPIRRVLAGSDRTIWLERVTGPATGEWVAFSEGGAPLFRLDLADGATLRAASRSAIWTTEADSLDVPYVVRYDLVERPGR